MPSVKPTSAAELQAWLVESEKRFGGYIYNIPIHHVSTLDPRTPDDIKNDGMAGGDRMARENHNYAPKYAQYLAPLLNKPQLVIGELGVLLGNGMALWCELFPDAHVIGLDIDLLHFQKNLPNLRKAGAFTQNYPQLFHYDAFVDNTDFLKTILRGRKFDLFVDDGPHYDETILLNFKAVLPHLAPNFVYFAEDNSTVHKEFKALYPQFNIDSKKELTVITPK